MLGTVLSTRFTDQRWNSCEQRSGVPRTHEHLGPFMDWDKFLNMGWEQRLDEARWLKLKVSQVTV
jgi:hypothetical protein